MRLKGPKGRYRFLFEIGRGSFDPDLMFVKVNGIVVGPTTQFWRVPGMTDYTEKTKAFTYSQYVCPMVEVYVDNVFVESAITEFPSHKEFREDYHFGEFSLALDGKKHEVKLVNGRGYRVEFRRVTMRPDERTPRHHVYLKRGRVGKHPRLFFTLQDLADMRRRARGASRSRWEALQKSVAARRAALRNGEAPDWLDVLPFAFMFLMTGQRRYFEVAWQGMQRVLARDLPGPDAGRPNRELFSTEAGNLLEVAVVFYDWCHPLLDEASRRLIRELIARVLRWWMEFIKFNTLEWPGNPGGMGHSAYNYHGLGLAGMVFLDEIPEAQEWVDWAVRHFDLAAERMPRDGSMGFGPYDHCLQAALHFAVALQHAAGLNLLDRWPFFQNFPDARIRKETSAMEIVPTFSFSDYAPDFVAWEMLAALTRNPEAQWLAERYWAKSQMQKKSSLPRVLGLSRQGALWRFLHHDPRVPATVNFSRKPLDRHFERIGLAQFRSGWFEPDSMLVSLYSGTVFGRKVVELEHRVSHGDWPTANAVSVYGDGEPLVVLGTVGGYRAYTSNCSTLTVDGDGQIEEGCVFGVHKTMDQAGRIVGCHAGRQVAYAAGEAAQCYEPEAGLRRFTRHLLFVKPDVVVVYDEVELSRPRGAEVHFVFPIVQASHFDRRPAPNRLELRAAEHRAHLAGGHAGLLLIVPSSLNFTMEKSGCLLARNYCDRDSQYSRITVRSPRARTHRFLTLLLPLPDRTLQAAPQVAETSRAGLMSWTIRRGDRETRIMMPRAERMIEREGVRMQGKLLVQDCVGGALDSWVGLGIRRLELSGWRTITASASMNVFGDGRTHCLKRITRRNS